MNRPILNSENFNVAHVAAPYQLAPTYRRSEDQSSMTLFQFSYPTIYPFCRCVCLHSLMVQSFEVKIELAKEFRFEIIDQRRGDIWVILCHTSADTFSFPR